MIREGEGKEVQRQLLVRMAWAGEEKGRRMEGEKAWV
jgi:hypothetical protein